jgi:hypothetical protein
MCALLKFTKYSRWILPAIVSQLLMSISPAYSFESLDSLQIHGFASQGYFLTNENNIYGESSKHRGTFGLTETGINVSFRPIHNIRLAAQGTYRHAGEVSKETRVDFALLDWTFKDSESLRMGLRLGRIKNPFGFYNETRDVAFTRPSITLPSIYYERSRNLLLSADGAQIYADKSTSIGDFSFQINLGELSDDLKELEVAIFTTNAPGQLESTPSFISKVGYESNSGATRLAFSFTDVDMEYKPGPGDIFDNGDLNFQQFLFSAEQSVGDITLTGEYLRQENIFENLGAFFPYTAPITESYYLQGSYRFSNRFKGYARYDALFLNKGDRNGKQLPPNIPRSTAFTKDYMVGLQWTPSNQWMVQAEYHRIYGTALLSFADNPDRFATKKHWSAFALQLSYRF